MRAIGGNSDLCNSTGIKKIPVEYLDWVITNYNEKLIPLKSLETALSYFDLKIDDVPIMDEEDKEDENIEDLLRGID